jgi:hypothetical protein
MRLAVMAASLHKCPHTLEAARILRHRSQRTRRYCLRYRCLNKLWNAMTTSIRNPTTRTSIDHGNQQIRRTRLLRSQQTQTESTQKVGLGLCADVRSRGRNSLWYCHQTLRTMTTVKKDHANQTESASAKQRSVARVLTN